MRALHFAFFVSFVALAGFAASCGNECNRALDCASDELCLRGVCTKSQATYLQCATDADCGGPASGIQCLAGRCTFTSVGNPTATTAPDLGMMDMGMDAGTSTNADAGP